jgi:hypothetical protein
MTDNELDNLFSKLDLNEKDFLDYSDDEDYGNQGEICELRVIKKIFRLMTDGDTQILKKILGKDAEENIILYNSLKQEIKNTKDITKAPPGTKSDFIIKFIKTDNYMNISIKSKYASPPAILNHTPRSSVVFSENGDLFNQLVLLDEIVKIMNLKRSNKEVGEDININKLNLNDTQKQCIINIIKYFIFEGSGSKKSISPANSILEIYNIHNINEWKFILCNSDELKQLC